jgi:hypothetical protein
MKQLTSELRSKAGKLIEHYHRYGKFTTETSQPELLARAGREVVWALRFVPRMTGYAELVGSLRNDCASLVETDSFY